MTPSSLAALRHIRQMEARIARQAELVATLRQSGQDSLQAVQRLALLHRALAEMRLLIGNLVPTERRHHLGNTN